jgi:hypothetical protein
LNALLHLQPATSASNACVRDCTLLLLAIAMWQQCCATRSATDGVLFCCCCEQRRDVQCETHAL